MVNEVYAVAIALNLREAGVTNMYGEYWRIKELHKLNLIYKETNGKLSSFLKLYRLIKEKGMGLEKVINVVDIAIHKLPHMESLYEQVKEQVEKMQRTRQGLVNDIQALKYKISLLDKTAFFSEQDGKRTEHRVQELADKKDILENLIANILNGEGYSKLKAIVKENVKVVLSEDKKLISASFAALIETLKADPQMIKLIQNIPGANDVEQYNNNNNITNYIEVNKDRMMDLAEKHYENLEVLTNNMIDTAAPSSSTLTLSSPQSLSPIFSNLSDQRSDIHRTEESKIYDVGGGGDNNNKWNMDD